MCDWKEHPISCPYVRVREANNATLLDRWMYLTMAGLRAALRDDVICYLTICQLSVDNAKECVRRKLEADPARIEIVNRAHAIESKGKTLPSWYRIRNIGKDDL